MPRSRVFLIATPSVSSTGHFPKLEPLAEFGDVKVVVEYGDHPSFRPATIFRKVAERLRGFDSENDYLVWAGGDTLAAVMAGFVLAQFGHRAFRWLRFERGVDADGRRTDQNGRYTPVYVEIFGMGEPARERAIVTYPDTLPEHARERRSESRPRF